MTFIIHYIVRGSVKDSNFDYVTDEPPTRKNLDILHAALARDARGKLAVAPGQTLIGIAPGESTITDDDIVIANIIPIPSGEEFHAKSTKETKATAEIGGS